MVAGKKLIVFSYDFPPSQGGIARLTWQIANGLSFSYDSVTILTRSKNGRMIPEEDLDAQVEYLPIRRGKCEWKAYRYLKKIKKKEDYIVICGLWHPEAAISIMAGMPRVYCLAHGGELIIKGSFLRRRLWLPIYAKHIFKKCTAVIGNSRFTENKVLAIAPKANVTAIPLGVDTIRFSPIPLIKEKKSSRLRIITVSRIQPHKGHLYVLEALEALPETIKCKIEWHIAGEGKYKSVIQKKIEDSPLKSVIKFHGFIDEKDLNDFYNQADLFILCSQETEDVHNVEGFGLVFLEAQAAGIPVVGTFSGGIPDAIESGMGGWLVAPNDVSSLTELLEKILIGKEELEKQGTLARERVLDECTWEHYCNKLQQILTNRA